MRTITLEQQMTFAEALQSMLDGKRLGIRPGQNSGYVTLFKPGWMNQKSQDFMLKWASTENDTQIRSNQFLEPWRLVIADHRDLASNREVTGSPKASPAE